MSDVPIGLFIFNRPEHTRKTLDRLLRCHGIGASPIFVFGDGPRGSAEIDQVNAARAVAQELLGSRAIYKFCEHNKGLTVSIIEGVSELIHVYDRAIVVEDDLELAPGFLDYMKESLSYYANSNQVYQIAGYMYDVPEFVGRQSAVVLPLTTTWGWGTWGRAWRNFDFGSEGWRELARDKDLRRRFNFDNCYDYASMLEARMTGTRQSWGIQWYWSVFRQGGVSIFPPRSLVSNRGFDGSGANGRGFLRSYNAPGFELTASNILLPPVACLDADVRAVQRAIFRQNGGVTGMIVDWLKRNLFR